MLYEVITFVNIPIALAPGMGLNAYFMTVVLSSGGEITWQAALGAVFVITSYSIHYTKLYDSAIWSGMRSCMAIK